LGTIEENGNAIDRNSSHRERIQSRAKASDNSKIDRCHGVDRRREHARRDLGQNFRIRSGEWGIGGQPLTTEAVKDLAAERKVA
jgi:hypothetical protein